MNATVIRHMPIVVAVCALLIPCAAGREIIIRSDALLDAPARYGLDRLAATLRANGHVVTDGSKQQHRDGAVTVFAGLSSGSTAAAALRGTKSALPQGREGLAIRRTTVDSGSALVLCGSDSRGLMYAALDTADRIAWSGKSADPFGAVRDVTETPYIAERGISMYTMQRAYFESRLFDENYWKKYFDLLARSRINAFTVIFGYENGGFMAPPYPYFFETPSHPDVGLVGMTREQQECNTKAFKAMIAIAHERGIDVIAAIWDHIYRGGVQGGGIAGAAELAGKPVPGLVTGLTGDNVAAYTKAALRRFMEVFPEIDGLEFRMHTESGLKRDEMPGFWHEVFGMLAQAKPGMRVTLRAKDLPDPIIEDALRQGLQARIETKYWMEQMGLPYHPTHINRQNQDDRRHGYADLLKYPQQYRVHWRLWSGGTTRLLLWGDPQYVRRYAESARLYDGNSLDVNEMLATKMLGEPHERPPLPILNANYKYYEYEFERYWHFYQVWGRVSYSPETPAEVWQKEFDRRFGAAGRDLMDGLHIASGVLPHIVAAAYRYQLFPTTRGWAEMMRQGDLATFADLEGTDIEQFMGPRAAARSLIAGTDTSKRVPEDVGRWFAETADGILNHVRRAEASGHLNKEALSTVTDLKILAHLARYHDARLRAAVAYNVFRETNNAGAFDQALAQEKNAIAAWEQIVKAAGDVYSPELAFGVHRVGFPRHWNEELQKLRLGLEQLRVERRGLQSGGESSSTAMIRAQRHADSQPPAVQLNPAGIARQGQDFVVAARAEDPSGIKSMRLRYRHLTQVEDYLTADMTLDPATNTYTAHIPGGFIDRKWDLMYFIEAIDKVGNGRNYPDLEIETPYIVVPVERPAAPATMR